MLKRNKKEKKHRCKSSKTCTGTYHEHGLEEKTVYSCSSRRRARMEYNKHLTMRNGEIKSEIKSYCKRDIFKNKEQYYTKS